MAALAKHRSWKPQNCRWCPRDEGLQDGQTDRDGLWRRESSSVFHRDHTCQCTAPTWPHHGQFGHCSLAACFIETTLANVPHPLDHIMVTVVEFGLKHLQIAHFETRRSKRHLSIKRTVTVTSAAWSNIDYYLCHVTPVNQTHCHRPPAIHSHIRQKTRGDRITHVVMLRPLDTSVSPAGTSSEELRILFVVSVSTASNQSTQLSRRCYTCTVHPRHLHARLNSNDNNNNMVSP